MPDPTRAALSRRRILQILATVGITGPTAVRIAAQARTHLTVDDLRSATSVLDQGFDEARLTVIQRALQRNLDQFQLVRALDIDDLVEPAPIFESTRR